METSTRIQVLLVIDHLGPGGAQRQFSTLAKLLQGEGYQVEVLIYHERNFFLPDLQESGIPVHCFRRRSKMSRLRDMRQFIRSMGPDVVIAYLDTPSLIAELAAVPRRNFALVVSERSLDIPESTSFRRTLRLRMHMLSDRIVTNSYAQAEAIRTIVPVLSDKIVTIWNCVDLNLFSPSNIRHTHAQTRAVCIGSYSPQKNPTLVAEALHNLREQDRLSELTVDWYGNPSQGKLNQKFKYFALDQVTQAINRLQLHDVFRLNSARKDVEKLLRNSDVLVLTSNREGCPNVVCEALASGLPVIGSRVGDVGRLVQDGRTGLLFEIGDAPGLASSLKQFTELSADQRSAMGLAARRFAVEHLSPTRFVQEYSQLITELVDGVGER